jgi:hypothetical protein
MVLTASSMRFLLASTLLISLMLQSDAVFSQNMNDMPVEKAMRLQQMIRQKRSEGKDVSHAVDLGKKSREKCMNGDTGECSRLLDEAIASLGGISSEHLQEQHEAQDMPSAAGREKKMLELSVRTGQALVTAVVPNHASGKFVRGFSEAFVESRIDAHNGKISVEASAVPLIIEEVEENTARQSTARIDPNSPFGIHGIESDFTENLANAADLGVQWVRYAGIAGIVWDLVEPEPGKFNWSNNDNVFFNTYKSHTQMMVTILTPNKWDQNVKYGRPIHKMPVHLDAYKDFLRRLVDRYDGNGKNDAPGSPVVKYWQIENEVDNRLCWDDTVENYGELLKVSYDVIKQVDPSSKIVLAGFSGPHAYAKFFRSLFDYMDKKYPGKRFFDVVDFHWSGQFKGTYKEETIGGTTYEMGKFVRDVKQQTAKRGYGDIPVWITEMSDYEGQPLVDPIDGAYPPHSETEQAVSLFKMYMYAIAHGVERAFWITVQEWHDWGGRGRVNNYFDKVGLINNPRNSGLSHKKLSYFTYKLMTDKLRGADWKRIETLTEEKGTHVYKFVRSGSNVYIVWHDGL